MGSKVFITIFFLLDLLSLYSQNKKIIVADEADKNPLPYATVKVVNENKGYYADMNGMVILENNSDSLLIEYSGYYSRTVIIKNIDTIFLTRKITDLSNVVVKNFRKKNQVGRFRYKRSNTLFLSGSIEYAFEIDLSEVQGDYKVEQIFLPLGLNNKTFTNCTCKIHLYKSDENGKPGEDILNEPILLQKDFFSNAEFYIDVSKQHILLSEKTLFVGLECILDSMNFSDYKNLSEKRKFEKEMKNSPVYLFLNNEKQFFNGRYSHRFFRMLNSISYKWIGGNSDSEYQINVAAGLIVVSSGE